MNVSNRLFCSRQSHYRFFLFLSVFLMSGCAGTQAHYSSNLVEFLYPTKDKEAIAEKPIIPTGLILPVKMGIAFVPEAASTISGARMTTALFLSEKLKSELMEQIAVMVKQYPFVKGVELIPTQYLVPRGSFTNLEQIRNLYGIDVIALLSYDQVQHTDQNSLSVTYWTLIGAYMVKGEKNDTSTMIDAAVFHISDHRMLFRAAGTSHVSAKSTPVNLSEQLRIDSYAGFDKAVANLVVNLKVQIEHFQTRIAKPQP